MALFALKVLHVGVNSFAIPSFLSCVNANKLCLMFLFNELLNSIFSTKLITKTEYLSFY